MRLPRADPATETSTKSLSASLIPHLEPAPAPAPAPRETWGLLRLVSLSGVMRCLLACGRDGTRCVVLLAQVHCGVRRQTACGRQISRSVAALHDTAAVSTVRGKIPGGELGCDRRLHGARKVRQTALSAPSNAIMSERKTPAQRWRKRISSSHLLSRASRRRKWGAWAQSREEVVEVEVEGRQRTRVRARPAREGGQPSKRMMRFGGSPLVMSLAVSHDDGALRWVAPWEADATAVRLSTNAFLIFRVLLLCDLSVLGGAAMEGGSLQRRRGTMAD